MGVWLEKEECGRAKDVMIEWVHGGEGNRERVQCCKQILALINAMPIFAAFWLAVQFFLNKSGFSMPMYHESIREIFIIGSHPGDDDINKF